MIDSPAHPLRRRAAALSVLLLPLGARADAGDLVAVDALGRPVAGVRLELVDAEPGLFGGPGVPRAVVTGEDGRSEIPPGDLRPVDVRAAPGQGWCVAFVHGESGPDPARGEDLLGDPVDALTLEGTTAVVLAPTGALELEVAGAAPDDVFHVTLLDERPEPFCHRQLRATRTFRGPRGRVELPAGRGNLYVCQEGYLGAAALAGAPGGRSAPHLVEVHPGGTTSVRLRMIDGPEAMLLAPFEQVPFEQLEALAPDGTSVVGAFPFDASPLRLPSRLAVALGTGFDPEAAAGTRYPKHFVRAAGVPLVREVPEAPLGAQGRDTAPAPLDLTFTVDLGGKLRLPEVEGGWLLKATNAARIRAGGAGPGDGRRAGRPDPGALVMPGPVDTRRPPRDGSPLPPRPEVDSWSAALTVRGADGEPLAHRELLCAMDDGTLARAITDGDGRLEVRGARGPRVVVCPLGDPGRRVELVPSTGEGDVTLVPAEDLRVVRGAWARPGGAPRVGGVLALVPAGEDELRERSRFRTRAVPMAVADAEGRFRFAPLAPGPYELRTSEGDAVPVEIPPGEGPFELELDALPGGERDR